MTVCMCICMGGRAGGVSVVCVCMMQCQWSIRAEVEVDAVKVYERMYVYE